MSWFGKVLTFIATCLFGLIALCCIIPVTVIVCLLGILDLCYQTGSSVWSTMVDEYKDYMEYRKSKKSKENENK